MIFKIKIILIILIVLQIYSCSNNEKVKIKKVYDKQTVRVFVKKNFGFEISKKIENIKTEGQYFEFLKDSLKIEDLNYAPKSTLRIMRNEIFAKKCYKFKSEDLLKHFSQFLWYEALLKNVDSLLSPLDRHNIEIIKQAEQTNGEYSKTELFRIFCENLPADSMYLKYGNSKTNSKFLYSLYKGSFRCLTKSKKYVFLLSEYFLGCGNCPSEYNLYQYLPDGTLKSNILIGTFINAKFKTDTLLFFNSSYEIKPEYKDSVTYSDCSDEPMGKDYYFTYEDYYEKIFLNSNDEYEKADSVVNY